MASEGSKRRSGKFFVTRGPVLANCKTPLTRKALCCLYFRKTKSEEHIVGDLFGYTGPTGKWRMRLCCPSISNKVSIDGFLNSGDPLQCHYWDVLIKILVVVLSSLHMNRNKLKGSEDFKWNNISSHHCDLCDFEGTRDSGWWFLADLLSGHVSTIILMKKCDSKYRETCFNRAFIITQSRKI